MPLITVNGQSYTLQSTDFSAQDLVNLYMEIDETQRERVPAALYGTPGLRRVITLGSDKRIRGLYTATSGVMYVVGGDSVYAVTTGDPAWSIIFLGTLTTSFGPVRMADNGIQVMLVDGSDKGYLITMLTNAFTQITDPDFPGATHVAFVDGYFVFNQRNSGRLATSGLYDGTTFDPLDFVAAEGNPDIIVSLIGDHREVVALGTTTTEVFFNSGAADFPFERIQGAFIEVGCAAPFSAAKLDNSVFWVGRDDRGIGIVWRLAGYQPQRVSTHAVEYAISTYAGVSDAVAYTYQEGGHSFYVVNFPSGQETWALDVATLAWHKRAYLADDGNLTRHRADTHTVAFGRHVVGDWENGNIYVLDPNIFTDDGRAIVSEWITPAIAGDMRVRMFHSFIELDAETGVGLGGASTGDSLDPLVSLRWSDTGGQDWTPERFRALGRFGNRATRVRWERLGASRQRNYRLRITSPVKRAITGLHLAVIPGNS